MSDDAPLFRAFVAGFKQSRVGYNAEYPFSFNETDIRNSLRKDFEEWKQEAIDDG